MSLRGRLLLGLGLVAVVLVAAGAVIARTTRADLMSKVDEQLLAVSRPFDGPGGDRGPRPGRGPGDDAGDGDDVNPSTVWVGVVDDDEVATVATPNAGGARPVLDVDEVMALVAAPGRPRTVEADGADRFRVVARGAPSGVVTLVGTSLDDVDSSVRRLIALEAAATAVMLALLGLVAFWVLRLGVAPLKRMTGTATAIAGGDLSRRVPDADPRTEAGELGIALNAMLARIEGAFAARAASEDRLRRFLADASHELRTPITTIRGYAELHRRGGLDDPEARRAAFERTEQEAVRMGVLVDDLLLLARLDQGRPLERQPVDLATIVADVVTDATVTHPDHQVVADGVELGQGPVVEGDDHRLRQIVVNLVGNAVDHTPAGTTVRVRCGPDPTDATGVVLEVVDDGPGMPPELEARAFERFARGDVARSRRAGSTGLGLSIVEAIVAAHGGTVALHSAPGHGTTVTVHLRRLGPGGPS